MFGKKKKVNIEDSYNNAAYLRTDNLGETCNLQNQTIHPLNKGVGSLPLVHIKPKRENYIHWFVGVGVMLFVAGVFTMIVIILIQDTEKGNLGIDSRIADLVINAENSYYNSSSKIANIEIHRGKDNITLPKIEILIYIGKIQFREITNPPREGTTKEYVFDLKKSVTEENVVPTNVSVAPVYYLDAMESLGNITSEIPLRNI